MANKKISAAGNERTTLADTGWMELEMADGVSAHAKLATLATYLLQALQAGLAGGLATLGQDGKLLLPQIPPSLREQWFRAWKAGAPGSEEIILNTLPGMACLFPLNFTDSRAICTTAPTSNAVFAIESKGVALGSLIFAADSTVGVFSSTIDHLLLAGDPITISAPVTDTGITDVLIALRGVQTT